MNEKEKLLHRLITASIAGYENLVVWADLLDRINVFPVADGDTGANLRVSLAPLRDGDSGMADVVGRLSLSGRGNSGNIAVAFLREFLSPENFDLEFQAKKGREMAWKAVSEPRTGTMLTVFDTLASVLEEERDSDPDYISIRKHLQNAVLATADELPELKEAGVVDSGALGMFLFFDGFFQTFTRQPKNVSSITDLFGKTLSLDESFHPQATGEYCVEASLVIDDDQDNLNQRIANLGNSAVIVPDDSGVKLHIHTRDPEELRSKLAMLGDVVNWSDEAMDSMLTDEKRKSFASNTIRIMTDAAGSVPRDLAHSHGIILLDSYILAQDQVLPESLFSPEQLYLLMKAGTRVSTAQASNHERYLHYDAAVQQYGKVLYLSTGSAFTGNFAVADDWQKA
ncbi:MAG: DAK2 domain-containing protein, partial [Desulfocapsa sp.]|nr:DAK2 domain-containing protein [Desulfocapsa sp.]